MLRPGILLPLAFPLLLAQDRPTLIESLNAEARTLLSRRAATLASVQTPAQAEARRASVLARIQGLLGPLPASKPPLAPRLSGTLERPGYRIEKVLFDSLPDYPVTANVYIPTSAGPHPAVLLTPGHSPAGKAGESVLAANFARNGFVALAWDPIGEGERLQYWDPALRASRLGRPTGEHSHASEQTLPSGRPLAWHFLWDAMRGLDYLASRSEVDPNRLGAMGCSGGGTVTAYLAALDPRVKAAATACYLTTYSALLESIGPQEAEQSIPGFLAAGLDFADWVELAAPKPYAIVSTTEDMFPFSGAQATYEEARRFYSILGARDRLLFLHGPGRHGAIGPLLPRVLEFFAGALKPGPVEWAAIPAERAADLQCTKSGQLVEDRAGRTIASVIAAAARTPGPALPSSALQAAIRARLGLRESAPKVEMQIEAPASSRRLPATLYVDARPDFTPPTATAEVRGLLRPLPWPVGSEEAKAEVLGPFYQLSLRAYLLGHTLVGLRVEQILSALATLRARPDVDPARIALAAHGNAGVAALHAAVLDGRLSAVSIDGTIASYRLVEASALHARLSDALIPGVLADYDLPDLVRTLEPVLTLRHPVNALGEPLAP